MPDTTDPVTLWVAAFAALSALATSAAAAFAARSAREARLAANVTRDALADADADARRRATLEQLRGLERRALPVWRAKIDPAALVAEVERGEVLSALSDNFLAYLNALDLHAFAVRNRMVDRELSDQYLRDLVPASPTFLAVINGLRRVTQDKAMYRELESYLDRLAKEFPAPPRAVIPTSIERERAARVTPPNGVRANADALRRPSGPNIAIPMAPVGAPQPARRSLSLDEALESAIARDEAR